MASIIGCSEGRLTLCPWTGNVLIAIRTTAATSGSLQFGQPTPPWLPPWRRHRLIRLSQLIVWYGYTQVKGISAKCRGCPQISYFKGIYPLYVVLVNRFIPMFRYENVDILYLRSIEAQVVDSIFYYQLYKIAHSTSSFTLVKAALLAPGAPLVQA